jgi:hypothetical protein
MEAARNLLAVAQAEAPVAPMESQENSKQQSGKRGKNA